jgi:hypothetical protein
VIEFLLSTSTGAPVRTERSAPPHHPTSAAGPTFSSASPQSLTANNLGRGSSTFAFRSCGKSVFRS